MTEALKIDGKEAANENSGDSLKILTEMSGKFDVNEAKRLAEVEKAKRAESAATKEQNTSFFEAKAQLKTFFEKRREEKRREEKRRQK